MADAEVLVSGEEGVVKLEAAERTHVRVLCTSRGEDNNADESKAVTQPPLGYKHQDGRLENCRAETQTETAAVDQKTSVSPELGSPVTDQAGCSGSVRSLCSNCSRYECPICSEVFDKHGDYGIALLNCDHTLCHDCAAGIMRRSKDPGRLRCPFCRQTTPFPQWEIRKLQEESYSECAYEARQALISSLVPELQTVPTWRPESQQEANTPTNINRCCISPSCLVGGLRLIRKHSFCFSFTVVLLAFLVCWVTFTLWLFFL